MGHTITEEEATHLMFGTTGHPGYCKRCNEIDEFASVEPDARKYECPCCGEKELYGFEEAFMSGFIHITK